MSSPSPEPRASRSDPAARLAIPITLSIAELEVFVGDFYSEELDFSYSFDVRAGSLDLELRANRIELLPYSADRFGWGRRELSFVREESGVISGFTLDAGNVRGLNFRKVEGRLP